MKRRRALTGVGAMSAASVLVLLPGCTGPHQSNKRQPTPTATVATATTSTQDATPTPTTLTCDEELSPSVPPGKGADLVLGLYSGGWQGATDWGRSGVTVRTNGERYKFFKTYTYVTKSAAPRTTVRVSAPKQARIAYIDAGKWTSGNMTDAILVRAVTRSVSLSSCGRDNNIGYAGGLLLHEPACVTLDIIAHRRDGTQHRQISVPLGQPC